MTNRKRPKITITPPIPGEKVERWTLATPENFEKIIWNSIATYNYKAQLDIAQLFFEGYRTLKAKLPQAAPIIKNICLRILLLYFEAADQFAGVCMSIINKSNKEVFETYIEGSNVETRTFYKRCAEEEISDKEIKKIWGIVELEKAKVINLKAKNKIEKIIKNVIEVERRNLKQFGSSYAKYSKDTGKTSYTAAVKGSFSIKHGFKLVNPSLLTKKIWNFTEDNPTIIEEIVEITRQDTGETKKAVRVGSMWGDNKENKEKILLKLLKCIEHFSKEIKLIAEIQEGRTDDPFFMIKYLHKGGLIKFGRNEPCPCASGKKFKKCHGL